MWWYQLHIFWNHCSVYQTPMLLYIGHVKYCFHSGQVFIDNRRTERYGIPYFLCFPFIIVFKRIMSSTIFVINGGQGGFQFWSPNNSLNIAICTIFQWVPCMSEIKIGEGSRTYLYLIVLLGVKASVIRGFYSHWEGGDQDGFHYSLMIYLIFSFLYML